MFDVVDASFSMLLDLYTQRNEQDPETGVIKKEWNYSQTLPCHARGLISNSATARGGDRQIIGNKYENMQIIEIRTSSKISIRDKITNIRSLDGQALWSELDYPNETPTVFELVGTTPMTDPFGSVVAYNSTLKRSENQSIGL